MNCHKDLFLLSLLLSISFSLRYLPKYQHQLSRQQCLPEILAPNFMDCTTKKIKERTRMPRNKN